MNMHSPHIYYTSVAFIGIFCCCNSWQVLDDLFFYDAIIILGHHLIDSMMLHNFNNKRFAVHSIAVMQSQLYKLKYPAICLGD